MRASNLYAPTLRNTPAEAEIASHQLMYRAGMIRKTAGGMYTFLPLAWRTIRKIEQIIREEMDAAGGQEIMMPILQPAEFWQESGRWGAYGDEMMRIKDGPGEARGADVGIAGGNGEGLIFRKGEIVRKVPEADLVNELFQEIDQILEERKHASK